MEPSIVGFPYQTLYFPVYSLDSGTTWEFLEPCTSLRLAKNRLKSKLPDGYHLSTDGRFKNLKCGLLMTKSQSLAMSEFYTEMVPEDFIAGE